MRLSWPLVSRSKEINIIEAALAASDVAGVVIFGVAGVGKSRIARDALAAAVARGCEGRWVVGTSTARAIPLGAFTAWAPPGVSGTLPLLRGVIDAVTAAPPGVTVVLAVDDVQLLDDLSIFVLHQIVHRGAAKVILTARDGEPISAAAQEIWSGGQFDRLDLQPLTLGQSGDLLSAALAGPVEPSVNQRLWELTRGNTLYLRNIVEQAVADGRLAQRQGYWRWIGDPEMPPGLVELIECRIGALPPGLSDVVDAVAVAEPVELGCLRRLAEPAAIEEADTRALITLEPSDGGVQVRLAHPLYGEVRRRRAAPTRLRRLRGLVAAELAAGPDHDDIHLVVRRATLMLDSDLNADAELMVRAAHGAVWLANLPLADRLAEAAVRAGAGVEASLIRAHALSWSGRGEEADSVLAALDQGLLTETERAQLAFLRASNLLWALGDPAGAKVIIDEASHITAPQGRRYIDAFLTVYWFATDQPERAEQASKSLVLEELPAVVGAEIAWVLATIAADAGRTADAVAVAEWGYRAVARSLDPPHMGFNIADSHVSALMLSGRIAEAFDVAAQVRRQAGDLPGAAQLLGAAVAGRAALAGGQLNAASEWLQQTAVGLSATHALGWGYRYQIALAIALGMRGSLAEATDILDVIDEQQRPFRSLAYERTLARAWVCAGQGAVSQAITILSDGAEDARAKGQFAAEVLCLQTAAQFGDRSGTARLREVECVVEGPRAGLAARFSAALADGDGAQLSDISKAFESMGDIVAALDAAAHAANVYRSQGLRGSALGCATRAGVLAEQCGGITTPALRQVSEPVPFTDREREIVMLIGEGLSNRAVAERLTLSVRTVESHIYRAMAKTGTTTREELAALLPRRGASHGGVGVPH
ncbi:helix-turn-helix transcriptional regulator [Mycobacterium asiaticum]|uniref:Helix-turn-helix transcriptional regulator n=1 Tax=Mycobacterium asiaticum TaxID=1790 RepID=A0A1A3BZL6_MYCAS|nr:helix-turn-helix transcriptional regulator [Mycobacterium asiaticum]OBI78871.1 helix-turn-helix transcriptional regulator [Mycobacterium asiaticum]